MYFYVQYPLGHTALSAATESCRKRRKQRRQGTYTCCRLPPLFINHLIEIQQVLDLAADVLKHVPETIDYEATYKLVADDMNPLNVVLLQEVSPLPQPL